MKLKSKWVPMILNFLGTGLLLLFIRNIVTGTNLFYSVQLFLALVGFASLFLGMIYLIKPRVSVLIGISLILLGLLFNKWSLEVLLSKDGHISSLTFLVVIGFIQLCS
ncbi:MAG: hypothetical protein D6813_12065, partial [Calditrichaeota bacterium]